MARPLSSNKAIKFSVSIPANLYLKLVDVLKSPFSTAPEGKLDNGVLSGWVQEMAAGYIANCGRIQLMEQFLADTNQLVVFEQYYQQHNSLMLSKEMEELL